MNRLLSSQLDEYIRLNPLKVDEVFNRYGISRNKDISTTTVIEAYQYFKSPFAVDLFEALYPEISQNMVAPQFSNAVGEAGIISNDAEVVEKTNFWNGFSNVLNGLVQSLPTVTDSIVAIKHGYPTPGQNAGASQQYPTQYKDQSQGFNNSVLLYIGIGFVALLGLVVAFKKI